VGARRDVDAVAALLVEDALFSMPPWSAWWRGREMIAGFAGDESCSEAHMVATRASGQPALASYAFDAKTGRFVAAAIGVLTLEGALIRGMTAFVSPEMFPRFNLPQELAPQHHGGFERERRGVSATAAAGADQGLQRATPGADVISRVRRRRPLGRGLERVGQSEM
jgi:hypothetical protein